LDSLTDQIKALAYSIGVHALCVLLITIGVAWTKSTRPVSAAGPVIEAVLVDTDQLSRPRARAPTPKPPEPEKPKPEKVPPPANLPPIPKEDAKDRIEQEKVDRLAQEQALEQRKEQEEKRKKEQEVLEQEARRTQLERERQKQLEDIRKLRADAQKKRELEEEKLAQLEDLQRKPDIKPPPQPQKSAGNEGTDDGPCAPATWPRSRAWCNRAGSAPTTPSRGSSAGSTSPRSRVAK
jgi:colicin import membrane protein